MVLHWKYIGNTGNAFYNSKYHCRPCNLFGGYINCLLEVPEPDIVFTSLHSMYKGGFDQQFLIAFSP